MKIGIYGSGAIGCYLGGRLAAQGADVQFLCRPSMYEVLKEHGLTLTDGLGYRQFLEPANIDLTMQANDLKECDYIFICVKSSATEQAAIELNTVLAEKRTIIISFQNGVSNVPSLKKILTSHTVLEGMVPFNVAIQNEGHFHQGTQGDLFVKSFQQQEALKTKFNNASLKIQFVEDMLSVQWAKVLINLNNSINALSKLPLKEQLSQKKYRECLAIVQREALSVLKKANITPAHLTPLPARLIPSILVLPNFLFKIVSRKMLAIDPLARSSMQDDLSQGKLTEIDWINGEIIRLADQLSAQVPANQYLFDLIKKQENASSYHSMSADLLYSDLMKASKG